MATRFTSVGIAGTLVVAGLATLASVVITTLTVTTGTVRNLTVTSTATSQTLTNTGTITTKTLAVTGTETAQNLTVTGATIVKTLSGSSIFTLAGMGGVGTTTATIRKIPCFKTGNVIGYMVVTATGSLATGACN